MLYKLDKLSLDGHNKEWCKRESEIKLENIYDKKILNDMNSKNDIKVNNIAEWTLLHDILNPSKRTKNINRYDYKGQRNF